MWVGANISVATAPAYLATAMLSPNTSSLGEPAVILNFNAGIGAAAFSPAAAAAYDVDVMLVASTGPWLPPVPVSANPSSIRSTGAANVTISALNLAPSRLLSASVGQGEVKLPLSALSPDGNSIKVSTLGYAAAIDASGNAATVGQCRLTLSNPR